MIANCDFSLSSQLLERDYAGVANTLHAQIAIFKFTIYLEKPETQLFYYAIKTRPTVTVCMPGLTVPLFSAGWSEIPGGLRRTLAIESLASWS